jgi:hypothetical protein
MMGFLSRGSRRKRPSLRRTASQGCRPPCASCHPWGSHRFLVIGGWGGLHTVSGVRDRPMTVSGVFYYPQARASIVRQRLGRLKRHEAHAAGRSSLAGRVTVAGSMSSQPARPKHLAAGANASLSTTQPGLVRYETWMEW